MIRDDVLLRQLAAFVEAALRLRGLISEERVAEARQELEALSQALVGLDLELLERIGSEELLELLRPTGELDLARCLSLAELMALADELEPAPARRALALELLACALLAEPSLDPRFRPRLLSLQDKGGLRPRTRRALYRYEATHGDLGLAEDHAHALLSEGIAVDLAPMAAALAEEDERLEERGLGRSELLLALAELRELGTPSA